MLDWTAQRQPICDQPFRARPLRLIDVRVEDQKRALTVRMEPKLSSATVLASALAVSCSAVYFLLTMMNHRKDSSSIGRMARVRAVSRTDVTNMSTRPNAATTMLRSAWLMLDVPALFMRRVSCSSINVLVPGRA